MITVLVRMRVDNWDRFKSAHDQPSHLALRRDDGNLSHRVLNQLDDTTDVVFLDTWDMPQGADTYYHSDQFERHLEEMGAVLVELIKLEHTDAAEISDGPLLDE